MSRPNHRLAKASVSLFFASLVFVGSSSAQAPTIPEPSDEVFSWARPQTQLFAQGEPVIFVLEIYTRSENPIFVSRLNRDEFVDFTVTGPDGKEVPWQGERRVAPKEYSRSDFDVLEQYHVISAKRVISLQNGSGFAFDEPGEYTVTAVYSLEPRERLEALAGKTNMPAGSFPSERTAFCVEACILEPILIHGNGPQAALDAAHAFYTRIVKYHPLGVPSGRARQALWPLLSTRLARELDSIDACTADYDRRYGDFLKANQYKGAYPWLEDGIFTGPDDAANPTKFSILGSRGIGESRVDVHLEFTTKQTYCCGQPASYDHFEGVVTVILENNHWVIDDYIWMGENNDLRRLSQGLPECKDGRWVGKVPY